jgi:hypothetical protein
MTTLKYILIDKPQNDFKFYYKPLDLYIQRQGQHIAVCKGNIKENTIVYYYYKNHNLAVNEYLENTI